MTRTMDNNLNKVCCMGFFMRFIFLKIYKVDISFTDMYRQSLRQSGLKKTEDVIVNGDKWKSGI